MVVGVGLIGEQHAEVYRDYPRSDLVLVTDLDVERARAVVGRLGCHAVETLDDVANSDAEVVSIATPDFAHYEAVMRMIDASKHVVVEKPLATVVPLRPLDGYAPLDSRPGSYRGLRPWRQASLVRRVWRSGTGSETTTKKSFNVLDCLRIMT